MSTEATAAEIAAFVQRHGLQKLSEADRARLRELAPAIARLGQAVPRTARKDLAPLPPPGTDRPGID
ncbi:hypothetical protein ACLF3G_27735 [Falsiroseomonas sp. HC035]|uniref:hypothetical protein n=1 Tax=Falsiroseomonas sp. HC035 TaxID=3390999 RepID=UPI003D318AF4